MKPLITTKKVTKTVEVEEKVVGDLKGGDWLNIQCFPGSSPILHVVVYTEDGFTACTIDGRRFGDTKDTLKELSSYLAKDAFSVEILDKSEVLQMLSKLWGLDKVPESTVRVFSGNLSDGGDQFYWKLEGETVVCARPGDGRYWTESCFGPHHLKNGSHRIKDLKELFGPHKENVLRKHTKP